MNPNPNNWHDSPIRTARLFRQTWISLKKTSPISRAQVIWLSLVIDSNPQEWFRLRSILIPGLSWGLSKQYALKLQKIGFLQRDKRYWRITPAAHEYYARFIAELNRRIQEPVKWH